LETSSGPLFRTVWLRNLGDSLASFPQLAELIALYLVSALLFESRDEYGHRGGRVGLFTRRARGPLPTNILQMMERFGRHEIDVMGSSDDGYEVFEATQRPLIAAANSNPAEFIKTLADACVPVGGWPVYGADRTVVNLIGTTPESPDWFRILDGSIEFLRMHYVPPMRVAGYAWNRFIDTGGTAKTWLPLRDPPSRESAIITDLKPDEVRVIAKLAAADDANRILVRREGNDYVALIDARWSDEDSTRSQSEWKRAATLYDLYVDVAWSIQVWDRADLELEPFFPAPKATI
jgi:hypothetical protein